MTFARALLGWYDRERRDLPWRRAPSAYATLVSELMLQQTVMATVLPYFARFTARFPDFAALAAAPEDEVLALWSGLGYYARARNLHKAARAIAEHGLPQDEAGLRALPGVGEYTAAVLAAIVLGQRTFALDGNAARVMARLCAEDRPIDVPAVRVALRARGQALVPADRPGDFAQAVMELGALVCTPTAPACDHCPVSRFCQAHAQERAGELPARTPRAARLKVALACVAVERAGRVLLVKRPAGGLLAGTWALPSVEPAKGESDEGACGRALAALGLAASGVVEPAGEVRHIFTHRDVTARVLRARAAGRARGEARWVSAAELPALALSSFARKTLGLVKG
ncbi:MAG TPA: A/G-specific adenine glycosylase [Polyangia bacterium]|nr:A/G-specific adenine glycosylase [Polyangia bacterium]